LENEGEWVDPKNDGNEKDEGGCEDSGLKLDRRILWMRGMKKTREK
jgi:hypothetical protein